MSLLPPPVQPPVQTPPLAAPRRRRRVLPAVLIVGLVAALVGVLVLLDALRDARTPPRSVPDRFAYPALDVAPGAGIPFHPGVPPAAPEWAAKLADETDLPERTLAAYTRAEAQMATRAPGCGVSWATLAGVGRVESRHGRINGTSVGADGQLSRPIIGIPLDGSPGVRAIKDTDGGRLDGDVEWDRAVGAMQFLPTTWSQWALRAAGDGQPPDPQNVDDAALTAANYLCGAGRNLATGAGWWQAVLAYNRSVSYARNVFSAADAYARAAV